MAERKRTRPKRRDKRADSEKLTKEENKVARFLRFNCPSKTTMLSGDQVHYFTGLKAVETLLESKWGKKTKKYPLFPTQQSAIFYMETLMAKGLFWRARKLVPKRKERSEKDVRKESNGEGVKDSPKTTQKSPKKSRKDDEEEKKEEESENCKKKKKIKLDYHSEQVFINGLDVYVWVFDPTSWTKFVIGLALVLGSIAVCLFPLWPPWLRMGVYYLSVVAMIFVGALLGVAILRTVLFGIIWCCTLGVHHFWLLPNLTEDCGFFDSFKPAYSYKYCPKKEVTEKKRKDDDYEEEEEDEIGQENDEPKKEDSERDSDKSPANSSESAEETSRQTRKRRKRDDNGFELVDK